MIRGRSQESRRRARRSEEESPERCAQRKSGEERKEAKLRNIAKKEVLGRGSMRFESHNCRRIGRSPMMGAGATFPAVTSVCRPSANSCD